MLLDSCEGSYPPGESEMSVKLIGSRTGIRLNVESVSKDAMGFDDLDEFWNATG